MLGQEWGVNEQVLLEELFLYQAPCPSQLWEELRMRLTNMVPSFTEHRDKQGLGPYTMITGC